MKNTETKECTNCGITQFLEFFSRRELKNDGTYRYRSQCKKCTATNNLNRYYAKGGKETQAHRSRKHNLKKYGLSIEQYDKMVEDQQGKCKICKASENIRDFKLFVDHCHSTGNVRGLLCHNCNAGLGHFRDSQDILQAAIRYLNESSS
jgi:hypothetical protein